MLNETLESVPSLSPIDFFSLSCEAGYAKAFPLRQTFLPDTSELLAEEKFADLAIYWNQKALFIACHVNSPFSEALFPDYAAGDSLELFIDTRDVKTSGFITRFCHHFVILPQEVQGIRAQEVTRFRTEDTHPLCDSSEITVETDFRSSEYRLKITIPADCLHGYDPETFSRIGFTYKINRHRGAPQHFSSSSRDYPIDQQPALWASLHLTR
jgi:hypothetical protein